MWTRIPSSSLRVTGADRVDFIHGQMTGDLKRAPVPGMVPCAFLNVRGQIEQFARVYRRADDIYVHLDEGHAPALLARLKRYRIFDQVELEDLTGTLGTVHVWQEADLPGWDPAGADVQAFALPGGGGTVLTARVNRTGTPGLDLHFLLADEPAVLAALGGQEAPLEALEERRVQAGLPDVSRDALAGTLPQEIGLDVNGPLPAISYRKGCYVGQEIMARLEARGNTRYHLARLDAEGPEGWPAGAEVTLDGRTVGQAGHFAGGRSVARVRKELEPGTAVLVGGLPATVQARPDAAGG